jgi:hypothetical protein
MRWARGLVVFVAGKKELQDDVEVINGANVAYGLLTVGGF